MTIQKRLDEQDNTITMMDDTTGIQVVIDDIQFDEYNWYHEESDIRAALFLQFLNKNDLTLTPANYDIWMEYEKQSVAAIQHKITQWLAGYGIEIGIPFNLLFYNGSIYSTVIHICSPFSIFITDAVNVPVAFDFEMELYNIDTQHFRLFYSENEPSIDFKFNEGDGFWNEWSEFYDVGEELSEIQDLWGDLINTDCELCEGSGYITTGFNDDPDVYESIEATCPRCRGTGSK